MIDFANKFSDYRIFYLFFVLTFFSCNLINPAEPTPVYMTIDKFAFSSIAISQGSSSNKIEDVWVYIDNNLEGIYSLPATIPVLASGTHDVKFRPGIYFNGVKSNRLIYPFYTIYDSLVSFKVGNPIHITPRSSYNTGLTFLNENFDSNGGIIFDSTSNSLSVLTVTTNASEVFEGNGSGKCVLDSAHSKMEIATTGNIILPVLGNERTIIELDYKTDLPLIIGIYAKTSATPGSVDEKLPILTLNKNNEWNKIYLEITGPVHAFQSALSFKIYFSSTLNKLNETATVYLDNFKVIYN